MANGEEEVTARSIRGLFDLPRYRLLEVERRSGWGRLTLVPRRTCFPCPVCRAPSDHAEPSRWRLLRDLDMRKRLPKAALVFDHFHVSKVVHDCLDEIRRRLQRELPPAGRRIIKGQRYVLLRAREKLSKKHEVSLQEILNANTDLTKGYILKEAFRDVFKATNLRWSQATQSVGGAGTRERRTRDAQGPENDRAPKERHRELLPIQGRQRHGRGIQQRRRNHQEASLWIP